jgi:hypothetical protein
MQISRNRPGVNTCDNCRSVMRPVVSWTSLDNGDHFGSSIVSTVHLCSTCLRSHADILDALPRFMEVMRYELHEDGIDVPPKAKYEEIEKIYNEHEFGTAEPDIQPVLPQPEPQQPTIPEIRRMARADLIVAIARYQLDVQPEDMTREQMIDALVRHFERLAEGTAA